MKKRQLDEAQAECASSAALTAWQTINWVSCEKEARKLQVRIVESHQHFDNEGLQAKASSPTLANITLDGMEALVAKHTTRRDNGKTYSNKVNLVRYADEFIVTGDTKEVLEEIKSELILPPTEEMVDNKTP